MKTLLTFLSVNIVFFAFAQNEITIDGSPCNMHGSSREGTKEYGQNPFKNRYNFPTSSDFDSTLQLIDFVKGKAIKGKFSQAKAVEVTGYVYDVKVGGIETCNCKTTDPLFKDTHIELTLNDQQTGKENRFIVEVTPRIRQVFEAKGVDWTTEALKASMKNHMVRIQGWLFYDFSHENENFADDPQDNLGKANWRATSWEIHPITSIEILDPSDDDNQQNNISPVIFKDRTDNPSKPNNPATSKTSNPMEPTPSDTLTIILLGAILGMVGQGLRVVVGIKKTNDEIKSQQIILSLFIAFSIGAIAGVLAAVSSIDLKFTGKSTILAFIAAGYAGTDFIEGFMQKNPSVAANKKEKQDKPVIAKESRYTDN